MEKSPLPPPLAPKCSVKQESLSSRSFLRSDNGPLPMREPPRTLHGNLPGNLCAFKYLYRTSSQKLNTHCQNILQKPAETRIDFPISSIFLFLPSLTRDILIIINAEHLFVLPFL